MEALNALDKQDNGDVWSEGLYIILNLLEPVIPHLAWELSEELFKRENLKNSIKVLDEVFIKDVITLAVSINGKRRAEIEVATTASKDKILEIAKASVPKWLENKNIVKEIVVPNKLVNLVVK